MVQDALAATARTSEEMSEDTEVLAERTSKEDQIEKAVHGPIMIEVDRGTTWSEEVVHDTIKTQDKDDHIWVNFQFW